MQKKSQHAEKWFLKSSDYHGPRHFLTRTFASSSLLIVFKARLNQGPCWFWAISVSVCTVNRLVASNSLPAVYTYKFIIVPIVTDRLTDRLGSEPIMSVRVNLTGDCNGVPTPTNNFSYIRSSYLYYCTNKWKDFPAVYWVWVYLNRYGDGDGIIVCVNGPLLFFFQYFAITYRLPRKCYVQS